MNEEAGAVSEIYREFDTWNVNVGKQAIHAKRMPGFFRTLKNAAQFMLWLPFFLLPYLRWDGRQAILFDIAHSQFHFFDLTVFPDDIWMLSLALLVAAMILFAATAIASRVWCGYFCFQTAWTDWFTWVEEKLEGNPAARRKLDQAPWGADKIRKKLLKHAIWMLLALLTGISFSIWFVDAFEYWNTLVHFQLPAVGWVVLALFFAGTYLLAGFLREQVCFWMCPYARIQGVMTEAQTILPTYDVKRGEPRGKLRRAGEIAAQQGDCIDCFQCVQVCPTGVDIRRGQQLGCITCGLCLDACDSIMDRIGKPRGLIRYASQDEIDGKPVNGPHRTPRTWIYLSVIVLSIMGIVYGLSHMAPMTVSVTPERQPLFVRMSDGGIQNRYDLKVMNKTRRDVYVKVAASGGVRGQTLLGAEEAKFIPHGRGAFFTLFVRAPGEHISREITPIGFKVEAVDEPGMSVEFVTRFNAPKP